MEVRPVNLLLHPAREAAPERFYQRFRDGEVLYSSWPRLTDEESLSRFPARPEGLKILFINAPIREWSYPNIMPIGHGYAVAQIGRWVIAGFLAVWLRRVVDFRYLLSILPFSAQNLISLTSSTATQIPL